MDNVFNCGEYGWLMLPGAVATYAVLALVAAAAIKYLLSGERESGAAWPGSARNSISSFKGD